MEKHVHLINETTARIELTQGYWALVDRDSLWLLLPYRWCVHKTKGKLYARTQKDGRVIYMHRLLMKQPKNSQIVVDHVDGNGLHNRLENLRLATRQENARNSPGATKHRVSSTRGVIKREHPTHPWRAYIYVGRNRFRHLGYFRTEAEAVAQRRAAEKKYFGHFAWNSSQAA